MDTVGHNTRPIPGQHIIEQLPGQYQKRWAQYEASSQGSDVDAAILEQLEEGTQKKGDEAGLSSAEEPPKADEALTADDTPPPTTENPQEDKEEPQRATPPTIG